jgi:hypothetical protein
MAAVKPEETLHTYLRRHFEQIAKRLTRQTADQKEASCVEALKLSRPCGTGSCSRLIVDLSLPPTSGKQLS